MQPKRLTYLFFDRKVPWAARFVLHPGMKITRQSCIFTEKPLINFSTVEGKPLLASVMPWREVDPMLSKSYQCENFKLHLLRRRTNSDFLLE